MIVRTTRVSENDAEALAMLQKIIKRQRRQNHFETFFYLTVGAYLFASALLTTKHRKDIADLKIEVEELKATKGE